MQACDDDMRMDPSDVTTSIRKWPWKTVHLPNKASKNQSGLPGNPDLFILHIIDTWQYLRANQIALFH